VDFRRFFAGTGCEAAVTVASVSPQQGEHHSGKPYLTAQTALTIPLYDSPGAALKTRHKQSFNSLDTLPLLSIRRAVAMAGRMRDSDLGWRVPLNAADCGATDFAAPAISRRYIRESVSVREKKRSIRAILQSGIFRIKPSILRQ
jgi:hypothetical protein